VFVEIKTLRWMSGDTRNRNKNKKIRGEDIWS
jgi:hypothetical protein